MALGKMPISAISWQDNCVIILDQRRLPEEATYLVCRNAAEVLTAIKDMAIRGAPAIGIAAAMGVALGALGIEADDFTTFSEGLAPICAAFKGARPTAINIRWAVARMERVCKTNRDKGVEAIKGLLVKEAQQILKEDIAANRKIGAFGTPFVPEGATILTHCNAGALATGGYGTALGIIRKAWDEGKRIRVIATETRPLLQGARLTCWELVEEGIPVTLITDGMAGHLMKEGLIDLIIVGADRIAANGDVANKVGTYPLAVLAKEHGIPFYVAAPTSTFDLTIKTGEEIPIEERPPQEVLTIGAHHIAPRGVTACNPAFDITPRHYVSAIITEEGVLVPPFADAIKGIGRRYEG